MATIEDRTAKVGEAKAAYLAARERGEAKAAYLAARARGEDGAAESAAIKGYQAALGEALAEGAAVCAKCGVFPFGMLKRAASTGKLVGTLSHGEHVPRRGNGPIYAVGCLHCPDRSALGSTPEEAVAEWNQSFVTCAGD